MKEVRKEDILTLSEFANIRSQKRQEIIELKQNRRVHVGPYFTFLFENYDTIWWQIHEMLWIEKGGDEQLEDEFRAYNPLIPQKDELSATLMIEIDDEVERRVLLGKLMKIEGSIFINVGGTSVKAVPIDEHLYDLEQSKAFSVHFLKLKIEPDLQSKWLEEEVLLEVHHPFYHHQVSLSLETKKALAKDMLG